MSIEKLINNDQRMQDLDNELRVHWALSHCEGIL
jgi:hypothetical protein